MLCVSTLPICVLFCYYTNVHVYVLLRVSESVDITLATHIAHITTYLAHITLLILLKPHCTIVYADTAVSE